MTATVPDSLPSELIAGDTWQWTRSFADYPAGTWTATVYFEMVGSQLNAAAAPSGTTFSFSIAASITSGKKAGRYKWWVRVTDGTISVTVEEGWLNVNPDPAGTGSRDHRSFARRALDAIEATLEGRATSDQMNMTIKDRSISRIPLNELMTLRTQLRQEVRTEEQGGKAGLGRNIRVRLSRV
jgi:hypothetical protein